MPNDDRGEMTIGETGRMTAESIEHAMLRALSREVGVALEPRSLALTGGLRVEIEGIDAAESVIAQLVPSVGQPKSHHRNKAMADMFKLVWLHGALATGPRMILCISEPLARFFSPASWPSTAARDLGVDVYAYRADAGLDLLTS